MHRRQFLRQAGYASATTYSLAVMRSQYAMAETKADLPFPIAIFAKVFQSHSFNELADAVVSVEADGVEATIRAGGHIEAKNADTQVPQMVEALGKRGKRLLIAASDVNRVTPEATKLLTTLRDNGVTYYRMGYYRYKPDVSPLEQVRTFASQAKELAELNREMGVVGLYQNHAGKDNVGNLLWDLAILLESIAPEHLGIALDLRHLRAEIVGSYQTAVDAIRPHLRSVYLKDTALTGEGAGKLTEVPLGKGMVNRDLFRNVWQSIKPAPLAVHVEYFGQNPIPIAKIGPVIEAYKQDVATLRSWML